MKSAYSSPSTSLSHHRLASIPLIYSPQTKTPFFLRLHLSCWRVLFACGLRLRLKANQACRQRSWPNEALS
jgi:hypothetical protein